MDPTWGEFWAQLRGRLRHGEPDLHPHGRAQPNTSPRGIAVLANTLQTGNGGANPAGGDERECAARAHGARPTTPAHKVNWRISPPVASTPPGAPTGVVTVQGASNTGLSVSWTAPSDTGSAAIAGLRAPLVRRRVGPGERVRLDGDRRRRLRNQCDDSRSLAADTAYRVQVRALGAGKGPVVFERRGPHPGGRRHDAAPA